MKPFQLWLMFPIVLTVFHFTLAQSNPEVTQLESFYHDKCLKIAKNPDAFIKLRTDIYEMYKYFQYAFQFLPDQRKTFCDSERPNLVYRIKEIENDLKACLTQDEKFLASFFKRSFEELLHFFCHNNGEYTRRVYSSEGLQCRKTIEESNNNDLDNCLNRIFAPSRNYVTQAEICDDVTVTRKCFTQLLDVNCPRSYDFKKLNGIFFDYVAKPCSSCVNIINNYVLMGLVVFNLLMYYSK